MDLLFRFEFEESYHIIAMVVRASDFDEAIKQVSLILGESVIRYHVLSIHKIY